MTAQGGWLAAGGWVGVQRLDWLSGTLFRCAHQIDTWHTFETFVSILRWRIYSYIPNRDEWKLDKWHCLSSTQHIKLEYIEQILTNLLARFCLLRILVFFLFQKIYLYNHSFLEKDSCALNCQHIWMMMKTMIQYEESKGMFFTNIFKVIYTIIAQS